MPKKKVQETPKEQSARFKREVEKLIEDGKLSLTEADAAFERMMTKERLKR